MSRQAQDFPYKIEQFARSGRDAQSFCIVLTPRLARQPEIKELRLGNYVAQDPDLDVRDDGTVWARYNAVLANDLIGVQEGQVVTVRQTAASAELLPKSPKELFRRATLPHESIVYACSCSFGDHNLVKFGYSTNAQDRIKSLQTGNPVELRLIGLVRGELGHEKALHDYLAAARWGNGGSEWFNLDHEKAQQVVSLMQEHDTADSLILALYE
jgi:hypothetical protein